jgi:hypothetical protein
VAFIEKDVAIEIAAALQKRNHRFFFPWAAALHEKTTGFFSRERRHFMKKPQVFFPVSGGASKKNHRFFFP